MTDPTGPCFLSYKRERATEAALLVDALRDHGVPVWQDVSDLRSQMTETALRRTLEDEQTSGAVMLVTPEVEGSAAIRNVEVPSIFGRVDRDDGFFVVPVAAGGLDYVDVGRVLGPRTGLMEMSAFNILKANADPLDAGFAAQVARRALRERLLSWMATAPAGTPVTLQISTRTPLPKSAGPVLQADLCHRFRARHATSAIWDGFIMPAFAAIAAELARSASGRALQAGGHVPLPMAVALGAAFPAIGPVRAGWLQEQAVFGRPPSFWSLNESEEDCGFDVSEHPLDFDGTDLALLVSATTDVVPGYQRSRTGLPLRAAIHVKPRDTGGGRTHLVSRQGRHLASIAVNALRKAATKFGAAGTVHLFLAAPAGLAFLIGQQLNTFGSVRTYEYDAASPTPYVPAVSFNPSG